MLHCDFLQHIFMTVKKHKKKQRYKIAVKKATNNKQKDKKKHFMISSDQRSMRYARVVWTCFLFHFIEEEKKNVTKMNYKIQSYAYFYS